MSKNIVILSFLSILNIVILSADTNSQKSDISRDIEIKHSHKRNHPMKEIFRKLNLSKEQREIIRTYRKNMFMDIKRERNELQFRRNSYSFMSSSGINRELMLQYAKEKIEVRVTLQANYLEKIFNILTYEQKEEFIHLINTKL